MIAVELESGTVSIREKPVPDRPPEFALLKTRVAGICNTDLELQRGYYGFVGTPGHEFVAEVVEADSRSLVGKRVAGEINLACGHCSFCAVGLARHCRNRTVLGIVKHPGAFAEFFTLPQQNLHLIPDNVSDEEAVFVEPLAAACEILDQVSIPQDERVAVLGDGKLGLLITQVLRTHGAHVTLYGHHSAHLAMAQRWGIEASDSSERPLAEYQFVIEATGSGTGLRQAVAMTRPRGTIVMKSTIHGDLPIDTAPIIVNEITLLGSRCGRFEPALDLLKHRQLDVRSMLANEFALADAPKAFAEAAKPGVLKVLLRNEAP
ncbi:MAG TPA: alcohol dehydrogenase catalytic domain-containing protein [Bryobacteraceae bacterium]|nr:alcohol dehydrogenase catalytic domain-containing protein [Bryobacteraceae bacterium]